MTTPPPVNWTLVTVAILIALILGAALQQAGVSLAVARATNEPEPKFVTSLTIGLANDRTKPVVLKGTTAVTAPLLQFFLQYDETATGRNPKNRIPIGEFSNLTKGEEIEFPILYRNGDSNELFWGNPRFVGQTLHPFEWLASRLIMINILVARADSSKLNEQNKRLAFWYLGDLARLREPFLFISRSDAQRFKSLERQ